MQELIPLHIHTPQWYVFQMSVAQEAKKAVENVYGTVYTVGSASNVLCE